jgi:hypothetical protein
MRAIPPDAAGALLVLPAIIAVSHVATPEMFGVWALAAVALTAIASGDARRSDLIVTVAVWGMVTVMFGLTGAGIFALAQIVLGCAVTLIRRLLPPTAALIAVTAAAAVLAACGAPSASALLGPGWAQASSALVVLAIGAPGIMLQSVASALRGGDRAEQERLLALGPQLVAMVVSGGAGGIEGVAAALAVCALAMPLGQLLLPGPDAARRSTAAFQALGVLAAGFVGCAVIVVALRFAEWREAALPPAIGLGLLAGLVALRVHAPAAAGRLVVTPVTEMAKAGN